MDWLNPIELFRNMDAKKLLFEARRTRTEDGYDALSARLHAENIVLERRSVAAAMKPEEIHEDVKRVFRTILERVTMADRT